VILLEILKDTFSECRNACLKHFFSDFNFAKTASAQSKQIKKREAKLRVKDKSLRYFDVKLCFALSSGLRLS